MAPFRTDGKALTMLYWCRFVAVSDMTDQVLY